MDTTRTYTRSEICDRVGLSDDVIAYWTKKELLRPIEDGTGRGRHKLFPFHQVNLAALIKELWSFGANIGTMRRLAQVFNDAFAFTESLTNDRAALLLIQELLLIWQRSGPLKPWKEFYEGFLAKQSADGSLTAEIAEKMANLDWSSADWKIAASLALLKIPTERLPAEADGNIWYFWQEDNVWAGWPEFPAGAKSAVRMHVDRVLEDVWLPMIADTGYRENAQ